MQPCITLIANTIVGVLVEAQVNRATVSRAAIPATVSAMPTPQHNGRGRVQPPVQQFVLNLRVEAVRPGKPTLCKIRKEPRSIKLRGSLTAEQAFDDLAGGGIHIGSLVGQQFPFWRPDLTGFHEFRHLRPHLSLGNCVEQQVLDKNLSGLIMPGIAVLFGDVGKTW